VSRSVVTGNYLQINPQATCNWTEVFLRMVAILPLTRVNIVALFSLKYGGAARDQLPPCFARASKSRLIRFSRSLCS
jgi:hypothetical protein